MHESTADLADKLEQRLFEKHGPLLGGTALYVVLGFKSAAAMRQAMQRDQIGVQLFAIPNRRGKFALTLHVAQWLAECAMAPDSDAVTPVEPSQPSSRTAAPRAASRPPSRFCSCPAEGVAVGF